MTRQSFLFESYTLQFYVFPVYLRKIIGGVWRDEQRSNSLDGSIVQRARTTTFALQHGLYGRFHRECNRIPVGKC